MSLTTTAPGKPMLKLRPYQVEAVAAPFAAWDRGLHSIAEVLPTGAGKTVVFAAVAKRFRETTGRGKRVLVLAHRIELIEQAADKIRSIDPSATVGIVKGAQNETLAQIVVASVQTLANALRRSMLRDVGLIVVDECHHAAAATYRAIAAHFGVGQLGGALMLGVTATLSRGDGKALGDVWQDVVYEVKIGEMIRDGWLVRPRGLRVWVDDLDLSRVKSSRGDYQADDLGRAIEESQTPAAVAKAIAEHAVNSPTIVFAPTVASAEAIREAVAAAGFTTALVSGDMKPEERRAALDGFRERRIQVLCNCMVLTEGTDLPLIECVVIARPTRHAGLYIQMAGRGLRPSPGKAWALIVDMVGAAQQHSLEAHAELFGEALDDENAKVKRKAAEEIGDDLASLDDVFDGDGGGTHYGGVGNLVVEEIDLFHSSPSAWLRTPGGIWFLPAGERFIVVHPSVVRPGAWDVSSVDVHRRGEGSARYIAEAIPDLAYARGWGEDDMTKAERRILDKQARWRMRAPDPRLREQAAAWGVQLQRGMSAGEVQSLLLTAMASYRLDPFLAGVR